MPNLNDSFLGFLKNLDLTKKESDYLGKAKKIIQAYLTRHLQSYARSKAGGRLNVTPRFFTQGSWAYKTLVLPYHLPPQNIDVDLGVYLPVSYLENKKPLVASKAFFDKVEFLLQQLAKRYHWKLDNHKKTCTCVVLNKRLHIDVPLYSISDKDFQGMAVTALQHGVIKKLKKFDFKLIEGNTDLWAELPSESVMLALREGSWQASDPRKLHKWFVGKVKHHGEQLRRVCRYVKAWRNKLWKVQGPSSLFLMALCVKVFKPVEGRDDLALLKVLHHFPEALKLPVRVPGVIDDDLARLHKPKDIQRLKKEAFRFSHDLSKAIASDPGPAQKLVARHLGAVFLEAKKMRVRR